MRDVDREVEESSSSEAKEETCRVPVGLGTSDALATLSGPSKQLESTCTGLVATTANKSPTLAKEKRIKVAVSTDRSQHLQ